MTSLERLKSVCEKMSGGERLTEDERSFAYAMLQNLRHDANLLDEMLAANAAGKAIIGLPRLVR